MASRTPKDVLDLCKANNIRIVDIKFTDLPGTMQHFSVNIDEIDESTFVNGLGFDGSSIRGFQRIDESDMLVIPDPDSAFIDPIYKVKTLSILCDIVDPATHQRYSRDPRYVAQKAEAFLKDSKIAEKSYWGPEMEFFMFDGVRFGQNEHSSFYYVDSDEGIWNSGDASKPNVGYRPKLKEGYFPVPPTDSLQDIRSEILLTLVDIGVPMEIHHHEVATAGQGELDIHYGPLTKQADNVMLVKYIAKNIAKAHGKTVTFMPKPLFGDNGTGMHVHQSLWKNSKNLMYDARGYALTSQLCQWYIGGLLKHAAAILAFAAPTTNSYRRLVPGYEAPVNLAYSQRNRSACVRIPMYSSEQKTKRLEFRPPDAACNPYLAFAAMLMAGLDGIINKIDPGEPLDTDIYELPPEKAALVPTVPGSLDASLAALEKDNEFMQRGGVITEDLIKVWLDYKRHKELDPVRLRPHPYEFHLYFDC